MRRLVALGVVGASAGLAAAVVRRLSAGRAEQELWREVTDPI